ncbi:hypothetical protein LR48_Vigan11g044100 [Vigna angularis]|uniref:Uncharacterized protein n=1 Tax=Phaseolus angularis TaxID=3914 RepID=A0A0L9VR23_PHAAN|nr:hypothetical protein LR48_Vigan11g044100 [Vigna angularis]
MGAVCSIGMVERNVELGGKSFGFSRMLIKENSFVNRDNGQGRKQKRHDSGFYKEELFRDFTIWAKEKVLSAKMMAHDKGGVAPSWWLEDEQSCNLGFLVRRDLGTFCVSGFVGCEEVFRDKGDEARSCVSRWLLLAERELTGKEKRTPHRRSQHQPFRIHFLRYDGQGMGTLGDGDDDDLDIEIAEVRACLVNEENELGETPLFTAAEKGHLHVVKELLNHSTAQTVSKKNRSGFDPLHIAASKGHHCM